MRIRVKRYRGARVASLWKSIKRAAGARRGISIEMSSFAFKSNNVQLNDISRCFIHARSEKPKGDAAVFGGGDFYI